MIVMMMMMSSVCAGKCPDVGSCFNLKELRLNGNRITAVPDTIQGCAQLVLLDLGNNAIEKPEKVHAWPRACGCLSCCHYIHTVSVCAGTRGGHCVCFCVSVCMVSYLHIALCLFLCACVYSVVTAYCTVSVSVCLCVWCRNCILHCVYFPSLDDHHPEPAVSGQPKHHGQQSIRGGGKQADSAWLGSSGPFSLCFCLSTVCGVRCAVCGAVLS